MRGNYVTVRRYEGVVDPVEAAKRVHDGFVPIIKKIPGFVGYYWVDAGGGTMISTSIFTDKAGEEKSNAEAKEWLKHNLVGLFPNPPQVTAGKVVAHS